MIRRSMSHLRRHVVAYAALFIVLGGSAVALPGKNTVDKNDLKKGAVTKKAIKKKAVTKKAIKNGAVTTEKIANNAVTGAKADEASFQGLIRGNGRLETVSVSAPPVGFLPDPKPILAEVPTMGIVELLFCGGAPEYQIRTRLLSFDDAAPFVGVGTVIGSATPSGVGPEPDLDQVAGSFSQGGGSPLIARATGPGNLGLAAHFDWSLWRRTGEDTVGAHVEVNGFNNANPNCEVSATVEYED